MKKFKLDPFITIAIITIIIIALIGYGYEKRNKTIYDLSKQIYINEAKFQKYENTIEKLTKYNAEVWKINCDLRITIWDYKRRIDIYTNIVDDCVVEHMNLIAPCKCGGFNNGGC